MSQPKQIAVCLTTVATRDDAKQLAESILRRNLAACVQVDGPIQSHYRWQGEDCCEPEFRVVIKTAADRSVQLREAIAEMHPYDQPQIITLASIDVDPGYSRWVDQQLSRDV